MTKKLEDLLLEVASHLDPTKRDKCIAHLRTYCKDNKEPFEFDWQPIKFMKTLNLKNSYNTSQMFQPTLAQQMIVEHIECNPSSVLNTARQIGNTTVLMAYAIYMVLRQTTIPVYYFSSTSMKSQSDIMMRFQKALESRWPGIYQMDHFHHNHQSLTIELLRGVSNSYVFIDNFDCIPFSKQDEIGEMIVSNLSGAVLPNKWVLQGQPNRSNRHQIGGGQFWDFCVQGLHASKGLIPLTINGYASGTYHEKRFSDMPLDAYLREVMCIPVNK